MEWSSWTEVGDLATARKPRQVSSNIAVAIGGDPPPNTAATEEWTIPLATVSFDID